MFVLLLFIYFFVLFSIDDKNLGKFFFMLNFDFMCVILFVECFCGKIEM